MKIFYPSEAAQAGPFILSPFTRYIVPDSTARSLEQVFKTNGFDFNFSHFNSYERRYGGQNLNGKRVVLMRSVAFGDSLMATAIPALLKNMYPDCRVDVFCEPNVMGIYADCGSRTYAMPLTFEAATHYDYHIFIEHFFEEDSEPEQGNVYDNTIRFMGIDPETVDAKFKRPFLAMHPEDGAELKQLEIANNIKFDLQKPHIVYQFNVGNRNRMYPPAHGAVVCEKLLEMYPNHDIYIVGTNAEDYDLQFSRIAYDPRVINMIGVTKAFRSLIPIVASASLVICPDSSILHLTAAFPKVPIISLWGLFSSNDRSKYYVNDHPLFVKDVCPYAPCRNHQFILPQEKCKDATNAVPGKQQFCNAIRAITPDMIVNKAKEILG